MIAQEGTKVKVLSFKQLKGRGILRRFRHGGYWVEGRLETGGITTVVSPYTDEVVAE